MTADHLDQGSATVTRVYARPKRAVRLIEHGGRVHAHPQPHHTPLVPSGWAPLAMEHQDAVLRACDAREDTLRMRLGSPWDRQAEYRVYELDTPEWPGVCVATIYRHDDANCQLLAVAPRLFDAMSVALDFFNWDVEAEDRPYRLRIEAVR